MSRQVKVMFICALLVRRDPRSEHIRILECKVHPFRHLVKHKPAHHEWEYPEKHCSKDTECTVRLEGRWGVRVDDDQVADGRYKHFHVTDSQQQKPLRDVAESKGHDGCKNSTDTPLVHEKKASGVSGIQAGNTNSDGMEDIFEWVGMRVVHRFRER